LIAEYAGRDDAPANLRQHDPIAFLAAVLIAAGIPHRLERHPAPAERMVHDVAYLVIVDAAFHGGDQVVDPLPVELQVDFKAAPVSASLVRSARGARASVRLHLEKCPPPPLPALSQRVP
jgi:hypothetical protein